MLTIKISKTELSTKKQSEEIKVIIEMFRGREIVNKNDIIEKAIENMNLIPSCHRINLNKQRYIIIAAILRVFGVYKHTKTKNSINTIRIDWNEYDNPSMNKLESNIIQDISPILMKIRDSGATIVDKRKISDAVLQNVEMYPHLKNYTEVGVRKMISTTLHHTPGVKPWSEKNRSPSIIFDWDEVNRVIV